MIAIVNGHLLDFAAVVYQENSSVLLYEYEKYSVLQLF